MSPIETAHFESTADGSLCFHLDFSHIQTHTFNKGCRQHMIISLSGVPVRAPLIHTARFSNALIIQMENHLSANSMGSIEMESLSLYTTALFALPREEVPQRSVRGHVTDPSSNTRALSASSYQNQVGEGSGSPFPMPWPSRHRAE